MMKYFGMIICSFLLSLQNINIIVAGSPLLAEIKL